MSLTLDNTISGTHSNSYCDLTYADNYWSGHYSASKVQAWTALTAPQKTQVLIAATRIVETARFTNFIPLSEYNLHYDRLTNQILDITLTRNPAKYYYYQALQFPRNVDFDPVSQVLVIKEPILMAQCEQAVYLLAFDDTALANRIQGIVNDTVEVGKNQIHLTQQYVGEGSMFSPIAREMLRPFFVRTVRQMRA